MPFYAHQRLVKQCRVHMIYEVIVSRTFEGLTWELMRREVCFYVLKACSSSSFL